MKKSHVISIIVAVLLSAHPALAQTVADAAADCDPSNPHRISANEAYNRSRDTKDLATHVCWTYVSAMQGDARAQANWGFALLNGEGVVENDAEALVWNQKSASQGNALGALNVSVAYESGFGTDIDMDKAKYWRAKAMKDPNVRAMVEHQNDEQKESIMDALTAPRADPVRHWCNKVDAINKQFECIN